MLSQYWLKPHLKRACGSYKILTKKSTTAFFRGFSLYFVLHSPCFFPRDVGSCSNAGCKSAFPVQAAGMGLAEETALLLLFPKNLMLAARVSQQAGVYLPVPSAPLPVLAEGCPSTRSLVRGVHLSLECPVQGWTRSGLSVCTTSLVTPARGLCHSILPQPAGV